VTSLELAQRIEKAVAPLGEMLRADRPISQVERETAAMMLDALVAVLSEQSHMIEILVCERGYPRAAS
jgi:hypothetical protein